MLKWKSLKHLVLAGLTAGLLIAPVTADTGRSKPPLAELWLQTSAEYKGLCYQAYQTATLQFERWQPILQKRADGKAYLPGSNKPVAIILDLDETVIDNSGFQAFVIKNHTEYNPKLWDAWCEFQGVSEKASRTVPGAVEFLHHVQKMGVTPIYISNRTVGQEPATIKVLQRAGLDVENIEDRMKLRFKDNLEAQRHAEGLLVSEGISLESKEGIATIEGEGEKEARRLEIRQKYDVLAYFGDVYGDFDPFVKMAQSDKRHFEQRQAAAEENKAKWGSVWFILPNPMYGSWSVGQAIPKNEVESSLNDYGFTTYVRGRRLLKP